MALITNTDTSVLPYNDDEMVYDLDRQMYLLTDVGVRRLTGIDLVELSGTETESKFNRYEIAQDLKNYISMNTLYTSWKYKVWLIAKDADLRNVIKRALADQTRYYVTSGAGSLKDMHGINITNGKVIDIALLRNQVSVSASVDLLLKQSGLLYAGKMYYSDYSDDGTW